jgi:hypothetical protein
MAEEPNGHGDLSRIDRIELAIEQLLSSQKQLLTAQIVMTDTVTALGQRVDALAQKIDAHEERIQLLIDSQLRVDETLSYIKKLLERFPGDRL